MSSLLNTSDSQAVLSSLDKLTRTLDPRDQLAHDIRMYRAQGRGDLGTLLGSRLRQLDPRDDEALQLVSVLSRLPATLPAVPLGQEPLPRHWPNIGHTDLTTHYGLSLLERQHVSLEEPSPPRRQALSPTVQTSFSYCAAGDDCMCGLPRICLNTSCTCARPKACPGSNACDCDASLKVCTDPTCDCSRPKVCHATDNDR